MKGCSLAAPGDSWCLTFALGQTENLTFFHKNHILGTPDFTGSEQ